MKKLVPYCSLIAMVLGLIAMGLRQWMLSGGVDDQGLYPRFHPGWILLCLVSVIAVCLFFLLSHSTERIRPYRENFPPSYLNFIGCCAGAAGLAGCSYFSWRSGNLAVGILSALCCLLLVYGSRLRSKGARWPFWIPACLCVLFAVRIFSMGKVLGSEPELNRFLFPFLATLATLLACYWHWSFTVQLGDRRRSLFWSLTAGYLCAAAIPGNEEWVLYTGLALWLLLDTCAPGKAIPRKRRRSYEDEEHDRWLDDLPEEAPWPDFEEPEEADIPADDSWDGFDPSDTDEIPDDDALFAQLDSLLEEPEE